jgi:hypothetical protein
MMVDEGVRSLVECTYIQFPGKKYVDYFRSIAPTAAISSALSKADSHEVSPHREVLRKRAADLLEKKAKKMREDVSELEASRKESFVGGQGKGTVTCTCKGACDSNKCKCFKAARICSSACHRNNAKCKNHDRGD